MTINDQNKLLHGKRDRAARRLGERSNRRGVVVTLVTTAPHRTTIKQSSIRVVESIAVHHALPRGTTQTHKSNMINVRTHSRPQRTRSYDRYHTILSLLKRTFVLCESE
jgi:hypothetical protein